MLERIGRILHPKQPKTEAEQERKVEPEVPKIPEELGTYDRLLAFYPELAAVYELNQQLIDPEYSRRNIQAIINSRKLRERSGEELSNYTEPLPGDWTRTTTIEYGVRLLAGTVRVTLNHENPAGEVDRKLLLRYYPPSKFNENPDKSTEGFTIEEPGKTRIDVAFEEGTHSLHYLIWDDNRRRSEPDDRPEEVTVVFDSKGTKIKNGQGNLPVKVFTPDAQS